MRRSTSLLVSATVECSPITLLNRFPTFSVPSSLNPLLHSVDILAQTRNSTVPTFSWWTVDKTVQSHQPAVSTAATVGSTHLKKQWSRIGPRLKAVIWIAWKESWLPMTTPRRGDSRRDTTYIAPSILKDALDRSCNALTKEPMPTMLLTMRNL